MKIVFEEVKSYRVKSGVCKVCGKRGRLQKKFSHTVNPFNKNKDGTIKNRAQVEKDVRAESDKWMREPFIHDKCK